MSYEVLAQKHARVASNRILLYLHSLCFGNLSKVGDSGALYE